jgi:hypothetical protein
MIIEGAHLSRRVIDDVRRILCSEKKRRGGTPREGSPRRSGIVISFLVVLDDENVHAEFVSEMQRKRREDPEVFVEDEFPLKRPKVVERLRGLQSRLVEENDDDFVTVVHLNPRSIAETLDQMHKIVLDRLTQLV